MPLFLAAVPLFGYAAYKLIDPKPTDVPAVIRLAELYVEHERPEAGIETLNKLLVGEKLTKEQSAQVHIELARAIDAGQKQKKLSLAANHQEIVAQTRMAVAQGEKLTAADYVRVGDSLVALEKPADALENYRQAMAVDAGMGPGLEKKIIELQIAAGDGTSADASLEKYLAQKDLASSERAWALSERGQIAIDRGDTKAAHAMLAEAVKLDEDPVAQGVANYRLGEAAWKAGDADAAERYLRAAREQLKVRHPLDAEACLLLGKIYQAKDKPEVANTFYNAILVSHPESHVAPLARLGRGVCRIMNHEDDAGLSDLHDLVRVIEERDGQAPYKDDAIAAMRAAEAALEKNKNYAGELEVMAYEQSLVPAATPEFFTRLAKVYDQRATQVDAGIADVSGEAEKIRRRDQVRELRTKAGDACVALSRMMTLSDDKAYGDALWRGIGLYEKAGAQQRVISALELFVAERPEDPLAAEATLRLGRAYQAAGLFDKAISTYQRCQLRYPKSLASSQSAVPLAKAYVAKGPEGYAAAERVLRTVVEDNPVLTPEAAEFREALFELANLYYRTGRFEEAIARLEEMTQRYPHDERTGELLFLMGDSYRKSAALIDVNKPAGSAVTVSSSSPAPTTAPAVVANATVPGTAVVVDPTEAQAAKRDRLTRAKALFDRVIETYRLNPPKGDVGKLQLKLAYFYRGDCVYDLGDYEEAIRLYDQAAFRYQEDPSALAAYVQIVNAWVALGKPDEAKTANERAKWLLRRMPPDAFADGTFNLPKAYWEQWLKWTGDVGLWERTRGQLGRAQ